jgi:hypothetical protein
MTTIDAATAGFGRWLMVRAERRARTRQIRVAWERILRGVLQIAGLGWLDYAAWDWSRTAGYCAVGITFILVSAMITGNSGGSRQ